VFDDSGRGSFGWVEQALQWVHTNRLSFENPITTVNLSIGTTWNAHTVPQWANLEDEFALLKSAGIFISVSAGNDFSSYNTTGVSYPAASPHVVPVASVNSTGTLSSFSQRSDRVLAAPGQQVVSTVPDYLFGADGVKNDFASASGTSMAAPWVAGASTLVREALQRVGQTNITQDTIYNLLRSTADSVFDTFTNANYARVNLRRAVETALASTPPATGNENWGRLASREVTGQGVSGEKWIDVQADRSGYATFEAWFNPGQGNIDLELYRSDGSLASASRSANAGERVDAIGTAGEAFRLRVVGTNSNVTVRFTNLVEAAAGTVRIAGTAADDRHEFRNLGSTSLVLAGGTGYEFNNATFANYRFYGEGGNDTITVHGSAADESAVFASRGVIFTSSNFSVRAENFEISHVYALGGRDIASFRATAGDDTFTGSAASALMSGTGFAQQGYGFEEYSVSFIAGGTDQVILNGSDGDDRFVASPGQAVFTTAGVQHTSLYHDQVTASVGSGNDTAVLRDSVGNDTFTASPGAALLTGDGFRIQADGFERVDALASTGNDIAQFTDSAGQDIFTATPTVSYLTGGGTLNVASGFDSVTAVSQRGGSDIAGFYDSTGDDTLTQIGRTRRLTGSGFAVETRDFAVNVASASNGGQDIVLLQELTRSDFLYGRGSQLHAAGADQFAAYGFERAVAQARSGHRPRVDVAAVDYLFSQG
jgi:hypothetical protein